MKYIKLEQYKYELAEDEIIQTPVTGYDIHHPYFILQPNGTLIIFKGYKWDGSSGPTIDSANTMTPSLAHDVGYQMIRLELVSPETKPHWDDLYREMLLDRDTSEFRANYHHWGVDTFGASSCIPGDVRIPEVIEVD